MSNYVDLVGKRFGRLIVVGRAKSTVTNGRYETWSRCKCDCGKEKIIRNRHLREGCVKSCGCYEKENRDRILRNHIKHGECRTKLYSIWCGMKQRCENPKNPRYNDYGGRGIKICEEWEKYENFRDWAYKNGYKDGLSIDRIDNDKGYNSENCRWATWYEQECNKRNNHIVELGGKKMTLAELSRLCGIQYKTLWYRLNKAKMPVEMAIKKNCLE